MPRSRPPRLATRGRALQDIAAALAASLDVERVGAEAATAILNATGLDTCLVYLTDPVARTVRCIASAGATADMLEQVGVFPLDGTTCTGRAATTGEPVTSGMARFTLSPREDAVWGSARQFAILPLKTAGAVMGTLNILGSRRTAIDAEEQTFLDAVAGLLALAPHNVRLQALAERERGRARFLADIGHAFAGMLNPDRVMEEVAARATDMLADWCVLYLLDARRRVLEMCAVHHADAERADAMRAVFRHRPVRVGHGVAGKVVLDRQPRIFPRLDDAALTALTERDDPVYLNELRQVNSWACLPLVARDQAVGALVIAVTDDRVFSDDDMALAAAFADRAALAIDNAQLYTDARVRARDADFLAETAALVAGSRAPDEILGHLANQATTILGDACGIVLAPSRRGLPASAVAHRDPSRAAEMRRFLRVEDTGFSGGPLVERLLAGETVIARGREQVLSYAITDAGRRFFTDFDIHGLLAVTLGGPTSPLGAMVCMRHGPPDYTDDEAHLLRMVADQTGASLVNALLDADIAAERTRLAGVIDQLPEGVVIAAASNGRVVTANQAAGLMLGRRTSAEVGSESEYVSTYRLTTADGRPWPVDDLPLGRALRGETVRGVEIWSERQDGTRVSLLVSAAPLRAPDGTVEEAVAVFQDITALKETQRLKDEWISIASHELRTPITSLKGYVQFLERQVQRGDESGPRREVLIGPITTISRQINRLIELVSDLLDVSRMHQGRLEMRRRLEDLRTVVRTAVHRAGELEQPAGVRLRVELPEEPLIGWWDADRIDQVVTNLITNALKYDPSGGVIALRVWREGDRAFVAVQDHGIGVASAEIGQLFQPFARAGNVSRWGFSGIGLGLYISRDIIERHGGRIWAESDAGQGMTVTFSLPLGGKPAAEDEPGVPDLSP